MSWVIIWNNFSRKFQKVEQGKKKQVTPRPKYKQGDSVYFLGNPCVIKWSTKYLPDKKVWQYYIDGENFDCSRFLKVFVIS